MRALLIVDLQNDFMPGGALGVPKGDTIIHLINDLQLRFPLVVATQDWHPADHGSFASAYEGKLPFDKTTLAGVDQILWPDHCVQGSYGAALVGGLSLNKVEAIFRKGMDPKIDSYSAFYDNARLKHTGLGDYLKGRGVSQVYVAGLAGDFCASFTVLDAIMDGFDTWLIEDATKPIDQKGFEKMQEEIAAKGGKIVRSSDIFQQ